MVQALIRKEPGAFIRVLAELDDFVKADCVATAEEAKRIREAFRNGKGDTTGKTMRHIGLIPATLYVNAKLPDGRNWFDDMENVKAWLRENPAFKTTPTVI